MDEYRSNILKKSNAEINRLQLLSVFFDEEIIYKIFLRTQVIHQLFVKNDDLEIEKLDLFHLQFTDSVIALLRKIKKSNEKNVALIYDEIDLNEALIDKMAETLNDKNSFVQDKQKQSLKINQSLRRLYDNLSDLSTDFPFSKNINVFSAKYANEYYFDLTSDQLAKLINFEGKNVYSNAYATIERKLMGRLCKFDFRTEFHLGLKSGELIVEIYKFLDNKTFYLFFPGRSLFLLCDLSVFKDIDATNTLSEREKIVQELAYKNDKLKSNAAVLKTAIAKEVQDLLESSYQKISDISFLNHLNNFDVQSNILKEMLKTDLF